MAATENSTLLDLPVRQPHAPCITRALRKKAQVVISIYSSVAEHVAIRASLHDLGYRNVRSGYETAISFHTANDPFTRIADTLFLRVSLANILRGCGFWEDDRSLVTYVNHFVGYARCDVSSFLVETDHRQYFPPSPLRVKGDRRFIDCGAFDGDTIRDLLEYSGKAESLVLFEPSARNFQKLATYVRENEGDISEQLTLFPCGVWDSTERLRFDDSALSASAVSDRGDEFIQCVAIDDVLHGLSPTCIKMDIEGAEPQALRGAEKTIRQCKPDLAISVYHSLSHFWEIPELIRQWVPEYRFFLRTYGSAGFETVMYAVVTD
jgi:FkbM family methyltransferase